MLHFTSTLEKPTAKKSGRGPRGWDIVRNRFSAGRRKKNGAERPPRVQTQVQEKPHEYSFSLGNIFKYAIVSITSRCIEAYFQWRFNSRVFLRLHE